MCARTPILLETQYLTEANKQTIRKQRILNTNHKHNAEVNQQPKNHQIVFITSFLKPQITVQQKTVKNHVGPDMKFVSRTDHLHVLRN